MSDTVFVNFAEKYWDAGFSAIPVDGKRPRVHGWSKYAEELPPEGLRDEWLLSFGDHNIGIVPGPLTGICVVDCDSNEQSVLDVFAKHLPPSPCVRRGAKGFGAFYRWSGPWSKSRIIIEAQGRSYGEILVKQQVVIPPSIHPDTKKPYTWDGDSLLHTAPDELPVIGPKNIKDIVNGLGGSTGIDAGQSRNGYFVSLIGRMVSQNRPLFEIVHECLTQDRDNEVPLFSDPTEMKLDPFTNALSMCVSVIKSINQDRAKQGLPFYVNIGAPSRDVRMPQADRIDLANCETSPEYVYADYAIEKHGIIRKDGALWFYDQTHYSLLDDSHLDYFIVSDTGRAVKPSRFRNFRAGLTAVAVGHSAPATPTGMINCKNGVVNIKSKELVPHTRDLFFNYSLDVDFDAHALAPQWVRFLQSIMEDDQERIQALQMFMGSVIVGGRNRFHKALVLYGTGQNGKSTFLSIMRQVIGVQNTSSLTLGELDKQFSRVRLFGKLANIADETPRDSLNSSIFKACVSGDVVSAAFKGRDEFEFECQTKFIFSCNEYPKFGDKSEGLRRRIFFVPFLREFKEHEHDKHLLEKLLMELPGVLNWVIEGYRMFERNGYRVDEPKVSEETFRDFLVASDSMIRFIHECVTFCNMLEPGVEFREIWDAYKEFCQETNCYPIGHDAFSKRFKRELHRYATLLNESSDKEAFFDVERQRDGRRYRGIQVQKWSGCGAHY